MSDGGERNAVSAEKEGHQSQPALMPMSSASLAPLEAQGSPNGFLGSAGAFGQGSNTRTPEGLHRVDASMDAAFADLYTRAQSGRSLDWPAFQKAVRTFVQTPRSSQVADEFFQNVTPLWTQLSNAERYEEASRLWESVVGAVVAAEVATGQQLHKGTGYYFWACNALLRGDVDHGLLLMYEAAVDDQRTHATPAGKWPPASASRVLSMNQSADVGHPASWWVDEQVREMDRALIVSGSTMRTKDIRDRLFLFTDIANVTLIVHAHASLLRLERTPDAHRDNDFVGRLVLGHLFHMAVALERILKDRSSNSGPFFAQATELSQRLSGKLGVAIPGLNGLLYINDLKRNAEKDLDLMLRNLLAGSASYGGIPVEAVDRDIAIAYLLRNEGGHAPAAPRVVAEQLRALRGAMLHAIAQATEAYY